jgi:hypothetical protein
MSANIPGHERRAAKRRPIFESFSLFVVIPKKGGHRLPVRDVSELGLLFDLDTDGESPEAFPIHDGENLELEFYLNQTLSLPLAVQAARIQMVDGVRRVGAKLSTPPGAGGEGYLAFLKMLDAILESARVRS